MKATTDSQFWAKTGKGEWYSTGRPKYHPVICHLADTAAVAMEIVKTHLSGLAQKHLSEGLKLDGEALIRFCGFMAGSHDLGKVSPAFQFQVSDVGQALVGNHLYDGWLTLPVERRSGKAPHGLVTAATLPEYLVNIGVGSRLTERKARGLARRFGAIVGGHHGFFPAEKEINDLDPAITGLEERSLWRPFSLRIFEQLQTFVGLTSLDLPNQCDNAAAMILAGLTTVSDWIASNPDQTSGFPYANDMPFDEYTADLLDKAKNALARQGWGQPSTRNPLAFTELFSFITDLRPLQKTAIQISELLTPPCLVMIEASMGEGKTEAALYLADHLQHQSGAGGFYIGLPTQATSNAMFEPG